MPSKKEMPCAAAAEQSKKHNINHVQDTTEQPAKSRALVNRTKKMPRRV